MATQINHFFDPRTFTLTYVVWDTETRDAVVIDPVLDYEPKASKTWTESVDVVVDFLRGEELTVHYVLETHAHADHLSGSQAVKEAFPEVKTAIGRRITDVQKVFKTVFDLPVGFPTDGRQFDVLLEDGEVVKAGSIRLEAINTPGHTPACMTFKVGNAVFTGDALFMPDSGAGRCDFPGGSAEDLYASVQKLYAMDDDIEVYVGHDYQPNGRGLEFKSTIGEEKSGNVALPADRSEEDFVTWRNNRDATLAAPRLLFQSVQVNVDAGHLPEPHANEIRYLKIPINAFRPDDVSEQDMTLGGVS